MQKILGHGSILTTVRYTQLTQKTEYNRTQQINTLMDSIQVSWRDVL